MGLNTQFPEWMQRSTEANRQAGAMLGQNILQGLRFQQGVKQQELENRQVELQNRNLAEIQDAQLLINQSQATLQRLAAQKAALEAEKLTRAESAAADLLALDSEFSSSPNGYSDENRARLYSFLREKPAARFSTLYPQIEKKFDLAKEFERDLTLKETELAARLMAADANRSGDEGPSIEEMINSGVPPAEAQQRWQERQKGGWKLSQARTFVDMQADALRQAGIPVSDIEITSNRAAYGIKPTSIDMSTKLVDQTMNADTTSFELKNISQRVADFNRRFGPGAFQEYVGPLDSKVLGFKTKRALDPGQLSAADAEARDIQQRVSAAVQAYRRGEFGAALTANEESVLRNIISNPSDQDYVASLNTFSDVLYNRAKHNISRNKMAPSIPIDMKIRYLKDGQLPAVPAGGVNTNPAPSTGFRIISKTPRQ